MRVQANNAISKKKRIVFSVIILGLIMASLLGALGIAHRRYVSRLDGFMEMAAPTYQSPEFPCLQAQDALNLGWAHTVQNHPSSSYINYSKSKKAGVTRIGFFGCSFVQGPEVSPGFDVPSQVQQCFRNAGYENVEVINFGVGSYGMHQSFFLWQHLGREYNLDYVVFFPYEWHGERDRGLIYGTSSYAGVHARYAVHGDRLQLIPVLGNNRKEASEIYFQAFPPWRYVRYDEKSPGLFRSASAGVFNPLYYRVFDKKTEILDSYRLILEDIAVQVPHLVIVANDEAIGAVCSQLSGTNVSVLRSQMPIFRGIYKAPLGHESAVGNQLKAVELFQFLSGQDRAHLKIANIVSASRGIVSQESASGAAAWKEVALGIESKEVGCFARHIPGAAPWCLAPLNFENESIKGLLQESTDEGLRYIALPFELTNNVSVKVSFTMDGHKVEMHVASVRCENALVGNLVNQRGETASQFSAEEGGRGATLETQPLKIVISGPKVVSNVDVFVGTNLWFHGKSSVKGRLAGYLKQWIVGKQRCVSKCAPQGLVDYLVICAKEGQFVDVNHIQKRNGPVELLLMSDGIILEKKQMVLDFRVQEMSTVPFARPCRHPITRSKVSSRNGDY